MKKILVCLAVILTLLLTFVACGNKEEEPKGSETKALGQNVETNGNTGGNQSGNNQGGDNSQGGNNQTMVTLPRRIRNQIQSEPLVS